MYSLIQLLDYPLVFLDLAKEPKEMIDSDCEGEDDQESNPVNTLASVVLPYRLFAQEIMVISSQFVSFKKSVIYTGDIFEIFTRVLKNPQKVI